MRILRNIRSYYLIKKIFYVIGSISLILLIIMINVYYTPYYDKKNLFVRSNDPICRIVEPGKVKMNEIGNISKKNIVFDASHHQLWSIWDTDFVGFSDLAILLMNHSFQVSASTRFINETINSLNEGDIYVLDAGKYQIYSDQEVSLIVEFVNQGGNIFVLGEHENKCAMSTFQNKLLQHFNMTINDDLIIDSSSCYVGFNQWITFNSSFFDINNITFFAAASITLGPGAFPIASTSNNSNPPNATVGAKCEYGKGKVICVTDTEFMWNGDDEEGHLFGMGLKITNNSNFILKIFEWLANNSISLNNIQILPEYNLFTAYNFNLNLSTNGIYNISTDIHGGTIDPNQMINAGVWTTWNITVNEDGYVRFIINDSYEIKIDIVYFLKPNYPTHKILISEVNYSRRVGQGISDLYNFSKYLRDHNSSVFASEMGLNVSNFDAICISNPLQNISNSQISNLISSNRMLVLGESYSTLFADDWFNIFLCEAGFRPLWNPLNELLMNYQTNVTHYLICDEESNENSDIIYPIMNGIIPSLNFPSYQSSVVNTNVDLEIFAQGSNPSWGENSSSLGYVNPLSFSEKDIKPTPLILYNSNIMVIGDTDLITNERGDAPLFPFLECWLKTGSPYVNMELNPSEDNISADGISTTTILSGKINDSNGIELRNGTFITVSTDLGSIVTPDEDNSTAGIQISITEGIINFTLQSTPVLGIANISAYNFSFAVFGQTSVEFMDESSPISNQPADINTNLYGTEKINWTLWDDFGAGYYRVLINDTPDCTWILWVNNTPINYNINRTQWGIFNYTIEFNDSFGNSGAPDSVSVNIAPDLPPVSNQPDDIITNTSGNEKIIWMLYDDFGEGFYRVLINGTPDYSWIAWVNNTPINYNINRSQFGIFNYTIEFNDSYGNQGVPDIVIVEILEDFPPTSNHPSDIVTNSTGNEQISWILWDDYGTGFYRVLLNGTLKLSWMPWFNDTLINHNINRSISGIFNYTIEFNDSFGNIGIPDTVIIKVDFKPQSNNPLDIITNSTGTGNIEWVLRDDFGSGFYQVLINGTPDCSWAIWNNNSPINYEINRTQWGDYNYTVQFNDSYGNWGIDEVIVRVNFPPVASQPNNISSYIYGSERIYIFLTDDFGSGQYRVRINGTPEIWHIWENNTDLNYEINRTTPGFFNYTFEYYDLYGLNGTSVTLYITLWENSPISNHPEDLVILEDELGFIHWVLIDDYKSGLYCVYINDTSTGWFPWTNNSDINFLVNTTVFGIFNYTIIFTDGNGNFDLSDTVIVVIEERPFNPLFGIIMSIITNNLVDLKQIFNPLLIIGAISISIILLGLVLFKKRKKRYSQKRKLY